MREHFDIQRIRFFIQFIAFDHKRSDEHVDHDKHRLLVIGNAKHVAFLEFLFGFFLGYFGYFILAERTAEPGDDA